jgi:hypothetical protein
VNIGRVDSIRFGFMRPGLIIETAQQPAGLWSLHIPGKAVVPRRSFAAPS